jgi:hypothetical protein
MKWRAGEKYYIIWREKILGDVRHQPSGILTSSQLIPKPKRFAAMANTQHQSIAMHFP